LIITDVAGLKPDNLYLLFGRYVLGIGISIGVGFYGLT